jgi:AcrR family transcriptional regulator
VPPTDPSPVDGRTARRDRNREAVLDAALELFAEGVLTPSATEVAERSGVSLRSVYRYYEDLEELLRASIARNVERNRHLFEMGGLGAGPLDERIDRFVAARSRLYEELAGIARAAVVRARTNEILREQVERQMAALRGQTEAMFAPELAACDGVAARQELADALAMVTGFEGLEVLRTALGRTPDEAHRAMASALRRLLGG